MKNPVWKMISPSFKGVWYWHALSIFFALIMTISGIIQPVIYGCSIDKITWALEQSLSSEEAIMAVSFLLLCGVFFCGWFPNQCT